MNGWGVLVVVVGVVIIAAGAKGAGPNLLAAIAPSTAPGAISAPADRTAAALGGGVTPAVRSPQGVQSNPATPAGVPASMLNVPPVYP